MLENTGERLTEQNPWQLAVEKAFSPSLEAVVSVLLNVSSTDFGRMTVTFDIPRGDRLVEFPHDEHGLEQLNLLGYFYGRAKEEQLSIQERNPQKELGIAGETALKEVVKRIITQWGEQKQANETP